MAEATSPDPEIQFRVNDEVGQGEQIPNLSPVHRLEDRQCHTPIPGVDPACIRRNRFVPGLDDTPPRRPFMFDRLDDNCQPGPGSMHIVMKPEPYNGKDDWDEYISHFQDCAELGGWSDRTKLLFLAASLRDQARTFYMSLSGEDKGTYRSLVNKLNQRFGSTRNQNRWLSKLEMRKRQPGESIAVLGDDIRQMAQRAYYNLDSLAQEALALNQLYKVISLEMKCRCIDKDCQTVAEAVDVIERYESIIGDGADKRKLNVRAVETDAKFKRSNDEKPSESYSGDNDMDSTIKKLITRLDRIENDGTRGQRNFNRQYQMNKNCFICNSPDHFMRTCPQRYQNQRRPYQPSTSNKTLANQGNGKPLTH